MQLLEKNRPVHRNDILVGRWGLGHNDATDVVSVQAREEMNWAPVVVV